MKRLSQLLGAAILATTIFSLPAFAASGTTTCDGQLASGTYQRLVIPQDTTCLSEGPVTIRGGLWIRPGATFVLGSEDHPGNTGTISGGVHATNPMSVQIHFTTINGGINIQGGSGPFGGPFDITWNAIEDNRIRGGATVNGYNGFWFGFLRNRVNGSVNLRNNVLEDTDGNEYVTNQIRGNLNCWGNSPAPQVGDSEGSPNQVSGRKTGQCSGL
jgi:hypothetical protein